MSNFILFTFSIILPFSFLGYTSCSDNVQTNLMRKVVREGRPPRPAQAPDFEDGKEDYIDYMNMFDETITTEPLVAPLPAQRRRPSIRMNRVRERLQKQGAHVTPMATVRKGKQMFARYKLELPVDVPIGAGGRRRQITRTQIRQNIQKTSNPDSVSDVVLRYDGATDEGEVAKAYHELTQQREQYSDGPQPGSEEDVREQIHRREMTEYEKEAAKARKIQEDYEKQVDKYKKDLEEYYTKYPQARPANYTGPLIAPPATEQVASKQEQRETVAELNKNAPDKDTRYEEISEDQLHRMGLDTNEMRPASYDPAAMAMTPSNGMQMPMSSSPMQMPMSSSSMQMPMTMSQPGMMMGGSGGGMGNGMSMGMNGMNMAMPGMGMNMANGMGMGGMDMSSGMMSPQGGMSPMSMNMMPGQMSMNGGGMGMQSMMPSAGMSGLLQATSPQVSFMQGRRRRRK